MEHEGTRECLRKMSEEFTVVIEFFQSPWDSMPSGSPGEALLRPQLMELPSSGDAPAPAWEGVQSVWRDIRLICKDLIFVI